MQEISSQLLLEATAEDSVEAKEKVHVIGNKLRLLLRQVDSELHTLKGKLVSQHEEERNKVHLLKYFKYFHFVLLSPHYI